MPRDWFGYDIIEFEFEYFLNCYPYKLSHINNEFRRLPLLDFF